MLPTTSSQFNKTYSPSVKHFRRYVISLKYFTGFKYFHVANAIVPVIA